MDTATVNKNRLFVWSIIIAVLNPIFAGLILGIWMMRETDLKKEGPIVSGFSILWGLLALLLVSKFGARVGI